MIELPITIRLVLATAGAMLPESARTDWMREWHAEFWHSRQTATHRNLMRALGAFADAWFLLRHEHRIGSRLRELARSRSLPIAAMVFLLAALGAASSSFRLSRDLLFHSDSDRLFLVVQPSPFMGGAARVPAAQAKAWAEYGSTVEALGRWSVRELGVCVADPVAAMLFSQARMRPQCAAIRVAPAELPAFSGVVGRLRPGVSLDRANRELAGTAAQHRGWLRPVIVPLVRLHTAPLAPVGAALFILAMFTLPALRGASVRACAWAASHVALTFGTIAGAWLELAARVPFTEAGTVPGTWTALEYVFPIAAAALAAFWLRRDARGRCRVCYRALTMPVFVGFSGRCLLDSGGIEYLCSAGHGALLTGSAPGKIETEEWSTWPDTSPAA